MRILVTGAAGFIGSHIVDALLSRGDSVVGVDNFDPFYSPLEKRRNLSAAGQNPRFTLLEVDIADARELLDRLSRQPIDAIVHLAAKAGVRPSLRDPVAYVRANVVGTQAVLEAARLLRVQRIVFASSSSVYGDASPVPFAESEPAVDPMSPYAATKRAGELLCRCHQHLYGGSVICLRLFTVYGARQRPDLAIRKFCTLISRGEPVPVFGDGSAERDYTWVGDIAAGILAAMDHTEKVGAGYQVVNLGAGRTTPVIKVVEMLGRALGFEPKIQYFPAEPGDVRRTWADVRRARALLGYEPRTHLEEGIGRFVEWFRDHARHTGG